MYVGVIGFKSANTANTTTSNVRHQRLKLLYPSCNSHSLTHTGNTKYDIFRLSVRPQQFHRAVTRTHTYCTCTAYVIIKGARG